MKFSIKKRWLFKPTCNMRLFSNMKKPKSVSLTITSRLKSKLKLLILSQAKPLNSIPSSYLPFSTKQPSLVTFWYNNLKLRLIAILQILRIRLRSRKPLVVFNRVSGPMLKIMEISKSNKYWKRILILLPHMSKNGEIELSLMDTFHSLTTKASRKQPGRLRAYSRELWRPGKSEQIMIGFWAN